MNENIQCPATPFPTLINPCDPCCGTANPPSAIKDLWIRKNKKGVLQVKINGKGKWIDSGYNEDTQTLTLYDRCLSINDSIRLYRIEILPEIIRKVLTSTF